MPVLYSVVQGDGLARVAYQFGFTWQTLWNHPQNSALKELRKEPEFLLPGDVLFIPDRRVRTESRSTDARHKFRAKNTPARFNLQLLQEGAPRANEAFVLALDGGLQHGTTDGQGWIRVTLPPDARQGQLRLGPDFQETYDLNFGYVDPVDSVTGVQARLYNLGYFDREIDGNWTPEIVEALREYQRDAGLAVTGELDEATKAALRAKYEGNG